MKNVANIKPQTGFTLIELVMVIVILGIMSATALPKFVNLGKDARTMSMKAVEGSMRTANGNIYSKAATTAQLGSTGSVSVGGQTITTQYGFAADITELMKAMDVSLDDFQAANGTAIQHKGATTVGTGCQVDYTVPTSTDGAPSYTTTLTDC